MLFRSKDNPDILASRESLFMSPVMSFWSKATEKLKEILLFILFVLLGKVLMIYESNRLDNISIMELLLLYLT